MSLGMLGKYEKLDVLGHGASGIVYLAKDTLLNQQVAIKVVNVQASDVAHFLEEARVLRRLRHPNIVQVHGVDRIDGNIVLDMEYVRGRNLQELLREDGPLPAEYALEIAAQTLDALESAHAQQIVHRDVKPANILMSKEGDVKLVDFGLAEILATNAYAGGAGTYAYMAPEDFAEENRSDHQSDIWAVGVTLYEMLTGQRPFQVNRPKDPFSWKRVLETELPTPLTVYLPDAAPSLQAILNRALAKEKARRYPTAAAFASDIRRAQSGQSVSAAGRRQSPDPDSQPTVQSSGTARNGAGAGGRQRVSAGTGAVQNASRAGGLASAPVAQPSVTPSQRKSALGRQPAASPGIAVSPSAVNFGPLHQGEDREMRLTVRALNAQPPVNGRVLSCPNWATVHPKAFDRVRQTLTIKAHPVRSTGIGDLSGVVRLDMDGSLSEIPVSVRVLAARPTFVEISAWFTPLFAACLFPVVAVLYAGAAHAVGPYVPAAALASAMLAMMLFLIGLSAGVGMAERIACGLVVVAMAATLGATSTQWQQLAANGAAEHMTLTGLVLGGMLVMQLFNIKKWRFWSFSLVSAACIVGGLIINQFR